MDKATIQIYIFSFLIMVFLLSCNKGVYYIDNVRGDDSNSGKSQRKAWATVKNVNNIQFQPGCKVLFRGNQIFNGTININKAEGSPEESIIFSSFGNGFATINGENSEAFIGDSCSFITIQNLNFTGSGRKKGSSTSGVIFKESKNILVDNVQISGFQKAGLKISDSENIRITNIHAFENGLAGILTGKTYYEPFQLLSKNIYIAYCTVENNPGDPTIQSNHSGSGIIISGTDGAIVEYCLAKNNGWDQPWEGNGPIGIWTFHSNNVIIQHCISHSNKSNPKGWDGGGFDLDGGVTNSVMQYNLSYNNAGPGYGLYQYWGSVPWENNIVRYNISINDGTQNDSCALHIWNGQPDKPTFKNALIYNNVFYNNFGRAVDYKSGNVPGLVYQNNILVSKQEPVFGVHTKSVFKNNLYWKFGERIENTDEDPFGIFADPRLILPDSSLIYIEDPRKLKGWEYFKLMAGSPALKAGKIIPDSGDFDFFGNAIPNDSTILNIGVWQNSNQ